MWTNEHSIETAASPDAIWRLWSDVAGWPEWNADIEPRRVVCRMEISGEAADTVGPELGPKISADFPETLSALARRAER